MKSHFLLSNKHFVLRRKKKQIWTGSSAAGLVFRASDSRWSKGATPCGQRLKWGWKCRGSSRICGWRVCYELQSSFIIMTKHFWAEEVNQILPLLNVFSLKHNTSLKRSNGPTFTLFIVMISNSSPLWTDVYFLNGIHEQQKLTSTFNSFSLIM